MNKLVSQSTGSFCSTIETCSTQKTSEMPSQKDSSSQHQQPSFAKQKNSDKMQVNMFKSLVNKIHISKNDFQQQVVESIQQLSSQSHILPQKVQRVNVISKTCDINQSGNSRDFSNFMNIISDMSTSGQQQFINKKQSLNYLINRMRQNQKQQTNQLNQQNEGCDTYLNFQEQIIEQIKQKKLHGCQFFSKMKNNQINKDRRQLRQLILFKYNDKNEQKENITLMKRQFSQKIDKQKLKSQIEKNAEEYFEQINKNKSKNVDQQQFPQVTQRKFFVQPYIAGLRTRQSEEKENINNKRIKSIKLSSSQNSSINLELSKQIQRNSVDFYDKTFYQSPREREQQSNQIHENSFSDHSSLASYHEDKAEHLYKDSKQLQSKITLCSPQNKLKFIADCSKLEKLKDLIEITSTKKLFNIKKMR